MESDILGNQRMLTACPGGVVCQRNKNVIFLRLNRVNTCIANSFTLGIALPLML